MCVTINKKAVKIKHPNGCPLSEKKKKTLLETSVGWRAAGYDDDIGSRLSHITKRSRLRIILFHKKLLLLLIVIYRRSKLIHSASICACPFVNAVWDWLICTRMYVMIMMVMLMLVRHCAGLMCWTWSARYWLYAWRRRWRRSRWVQIAECWEP